MILTNDKSLMRKIKDGNNVHSNSDNDNGRTIDHDDDKNDDKKMMMNDDEWWMMVHDDDEDDKEEEGDS